MTRLLRWQAEIYVRMALRQWGIPVQTISTKVQSWLGMEWLTLTEWTDTGGHSHWVLDWSFCSFDPTTWSHAICLEPDKLRQSRFGRFV